MNSKIFLIIGWLLLANLVLISSMVSAKALAETNENIEHSKKVDNKAKHVDQFGGFPGVGFGGFPGGGFGGFPGGGFGGGPGGFGRYPGRGSGGFGPGRGRRTGVGGRGAFEGCYYGCCGNSGSGCDRCCNYPNEDVDSHTDQLAQP